MTMTEPVVVRIDLAPATVTYTPSDGESQVVGNTRVIVTADRIYVFSDTRPIPTSWIDQRIESIEGRNTIGYQVMTASGDIVHFKRGGGCACGSQIRSFRPFPQGMVQGPYAST